MDAGARPRQLSHKQPSACLRAELCPEPLVVVRKTNADVCHLQTWTSFKAP